MLRRSLQLAPRSMTTNPLACAAKGCRHENMRSEFLSISRKCTDCNLPRLEPTRTPEKLAHVMLAEAGCRPATFSVAFSDDGSGTIYSARNENKFRGSKIKAMPLISDVIWPDTFPPVSSASLARHKEPNKLFEKSIDRPARRASSVDTIPLGISIRDGEAHFSHTFRTFREALN